MDKRDVVVFSALALVFVLTYNMLKDALGSEGNVLLSFVILAGCGLFSFWWAFFFIRTKPMAKQLVYTGVCCSIVLATAFFVAKAKVSKQSLQTESQVVAGNTSPLTGSWTAAKSGTETINLRFFGSDSVRIALGAKELDYAYNRTPDNRILIYDQDEDVRFAWTIEKSTSDSLIIQYGDEVLRFKKSFY
jgi:hypothetical protein